jgi:photosystem II stability/assembly factor-like uncharacterized protein
MSKSLLNQIFTLLRTNWGAQVAFVSLLIWLVGSLFLIFHPPKYTDKVFSNFAEMDNSNRVSLQVDREGSHLWLLTDHGILNSPDGGHSWSWQYQLGGRTSANYFDDLFLLDTPAITTDFLGNKTKDPPTIWAVGSNGHVIVSNNGGDSWQDSSGCTENNSDGGSARTETLHSVFFVDKSHGWIAGDQGLICVTEDGGETWTMQKSGLGTTLNSTYFFDTLNGWVVGEKGTLLYTTDGGKQWVKHPLSSVHFPHFRDILFQDNQIGWIVGDQGILLSTINGGVDWTPSTNVKALVKGRDKNLLSLSIKADGSNKIRVWTGSAHHLLYKDGIKDWELIKDFPEDISIAQIHFSKTQNWLTLSGRPSLLTSIDGVHDWQRIIPMPYDLSRNYWYATFGFGLLFLFGIWRARSGLNTVAAGQDDPIAAIFSADRPQQGAELDALGTRPLAWAVSRFLRHRRTEPPLTIAIDAPWGGGKSSLMNWLRYDLERFGYRPVWFNAWHYEKQEQMFPALMEQIRRNALPSWFSLDGIRFRLFIFKKRFTESPLFFLICLILSAFAFGYLEHNLNSLRPQAKQHITCFIEQYFPKQPPLGRPDWLKNSNCAGVSSSNSGGEQDKNGNIISFHDYLMPLLGGVPLIGLLMAFQAFQKPDDIFSKFFNNSEEGKSRRETVVKEQFANDFAAVTEALHKPLVIFIDDLDRCHHRSVCEVLETVNFLSLAGHCYVIFGMWQSGVELAVGLGFAEAAMEHAAIQQATTVDISSEAGKANIRRQYGRLYLEKLINIWIHVPVMNICATEKMLVTDQEGENQETSRKMWLWSSLSKWTSHRESGSKFKMRLNSLLKRESWHIPTVLSKLGLIAKNIWFVFRWLLARLVWMLVIVIGFWMPAFLIYTLNKAHVVPTDFINYLWASVFGQALLFIIFFIFSPSHWRSVAFSEILPSWLAPSAIRALFRAENTFRSTLKKIHSVEWLSLVRFVFKQLLIIALLFIMSISNSGSQQLTDYLGLIFSSLGLLYFLPTQPFFLWLLGILRKLLPQHAPSISVLFRFVAFAGVVFLVYAGYQQGVSWPPKLNSPNQQTEKAQVEPTEKVKLEPLKAAQLMHLTKKVLADIPCNEWFDGVKEYCINKNPNTSMVIKPKEEQKASENTSPAKSKSNEIASVANVGICRSVSPIPPWEENNPKKQMQEALSESSSPVQAKPSELASVANVGICHSVSPIPPWEENNPKKQIQSPVDVSHSPVIEDIPKQNSIISLPIGNFITYISVTLVAILLFSIRTLQETLEAIYDTPEFEESLKFWAPVLHARFSTPRRIKRFINDLRFKAISSAPSHGKDRTAWESIWERYINAQNKSEPEVTRINGSESKLLMRCILQTCCGEEYKNYLDESGNLVSAWNEKINLNTELVNEFGSKWAEQLLGILIVKLQSFEHFGAETVTTQ